MSDKYFKVVEGWEVGDLRVQVTYPSNSPFEDAILREVPAPSSEWKPMSEFVDDGNVWEFLHENKLRIDVVKFIRINEWYVDPKNVFTHFRPHVPPVEKDLCREAFERNWDKERISFQKKPTPEQKQYAFEQWKAAWEARGEVK